MSRPRIVSTRWLDGRSRAPEAARPQLLDLLGLPVDTTDVDTILATITDLANDETGDGVNAKPSAVAAAAKRAGLEVLDTDTATALRRDAAEGRQIKAAAALAKVAASVDDAISRGKITVGRRKHWLSLIAADPGMAEVLASVPDEMAVPLTEIGHRTVGIVELWARMWTEPTPK